MIRDEGAAGPVPSTFSAEDLAKLDAQGIAYSQAVRDRAGATKDPSPATNSLYKYLPVCRVDVLRTLQFKFTPPDEFQDVFDSAWHDDPDATLNVPGADIYFMQILTRSQSPSIYEIERFQKFCSDTKRLFPRAKPPSLCTIPELPSPEAIRSFLEGYRAEWHQATNGLVVFSVTDQPDNLPLWQSYADGHQGFVIGFKPTSDLFYLNGRAMIEQISYLPKPVVGPPEVSCKRRYQVKHESFQHEREWRAMFPRSVLNQRIVDGRVMWFKAASISDIVEVILGCRASMGLQKEISQLLPRDIPLKRAVIRSGDYALDMVEVTRQ